MTAPATTPELYTVHDTRVENVTLIHDAALPWVIRKGGKLPIILDPRYETQAEADCAALGLNHAAGKKAEAA
jgi:hypothetical protein